MKGNSLFCGECKEPLPSKFAMILHTTVCHLRNREEPEEPPSKRLKTDESSDELSSVVAQYGPSRATSNNGFRPIPMQTDSEDEPRNENGFFRRLLRPFRVLIETVTSIGSSLFHAVSTQVVPYCAPMNGPFRALNSFMNYISQSYNRFISPIDDEMESLLEALNDNDLANDDFITELIYFDSEVESNDGNSLFDEENRSNSDIQVSTVNEDAKPCEKMEMPNTKDFFCQKCFIHVHTADELLNLHNLIIHRIKPNL